MAPAYTYMLRTIDGRLIFADGNDWTEACASVSISPERIRRHMPVRYLGDHKPMTNDARNALLERRKIQKACADHNFAFHKVTSRGSIFKCAKCGARSMRRDPNAKGKGRKRKGK